LSEILKRLDILERGQNKLWENQNKLWENQNRLWEEIKALREGQNKLWENQNKLWEEIKALREGQNRLWENQNKLWEELKSLREGQNKLWEEVKALREGQNKLWENQNKLWENQNRLWEEVKFLRINYDRMRKYMISGFRDLKASIGVAFQDHAASFLQLMLEEMGYPDAKVERKILVYNGEAVEINLFCEKPLIVGEATVSVRSIKEAEREVEKLLMRTKIVEEKYGRKPEMVVLSIARVVEDASKILKELAEKHGMKLIFGKEMEEALAI
jgi:predicted nuclease with TOPRIM domain